MDELILKRIAGLITAQSGLRLREQDRPQLLEILWQRVHHRGLSSLQDYYDLLVQELDCHSGLGSTSTPSFPAQPLEWHDLFVALTINESYFFRDRQQFDLLTRTLLPELIHRKQQQHRPTLAHPRPTLRLWSAGCSTGEELYSLAIVLHELNFPWDQWETLLIGTDISLTALKTARAGVYGNWSFRQTEAILQQKYFHLHRQSLQVCDGIRQRVTFQYGNLTSDRLSPGQTSFHDIDLILCRNVFIYFEHEFIGRILEKFHQALAPQGYLMTGHTELYGQDTHAFQVKNFPESLVFQRRSLAATVSAPSSDRPTLGPPRSRPMSLALLTPSSAAGKALPIPEPPATAADSLAIGLQEAQAFLAQKAYREAIRVVEKLGAEYPHSFEASLVAAQAYANIGDHTTAKRYCQKALKLDPLNLELHYLQAQIAEEEGQLDAAKEHLRRVLYLDAQAVRAYLDLASIYQQEHRPDQERKMQQLALRTLKLLPETTIVDVQTGATVLEWRNHLEKRLIS